MSTSETVPANYDRISSVYTQFRRPDSRIASLIDRALGDAETVLNVGAGTGSYEPENKKVVAIDASFSMCEKRPNNLTKPLVAFAERLPFRDKAFDASMAVMTAHHWKDLEAGLHEMRRVTRGAVVIMTCDPTKLADFWVNDYAPETIAIRKGRYPTIKKLQELLGEKTEVAPVPIPLDCTDEFTESSYGRPEMLLDQERHKASSTWSVVEASIVDRFRSTLSRDLENGTWDRKYGHLRSQPSYEGSLTLVIG